MRSLVLFPLLLLLCAVVSVSQAGAQMKAVKLCGREFLRAVIFTCGGSRWRRVFTESESEAPPAPEPSSLESFNSPASELTKRDMNHLLSTMCCQLGCRKSDLTFLC